MVDRYLLPIAKTKNHMSNLRWRNKYPTSIIILGQALIFVFLINRYFTMRIVSI